MRDQESRGGRARAALAALLIATAAGGAPLLDAQAEEANPDRSWIHNLIDSSAHGYEYGYAPAVIWQDDRYHLFYCSSGTGPSAWDFIRHAASPDGEVWSAPDVILAPSDGEGERATCDPSVVRYDAGDGPFYYLFYSGNARDVQTVMFVARASAIDGPYLKYTWRGTWESNAADPMPVLGPQRPAPDGTSWYGAGQQAVVVRDGRLYGWYTDDTAAFPDLAHRTKQVRFSSTTDPTRWPEGADTNVADPSDASAEVKLDAATGDFVMFQTAHEHRRNSSLVRRTSRDGLTWSDAATVADEGRYAAWAHNVGVSSGADGSLLTRVLVAFGAPFDLAPDYDNNCVLSPDNCWGRWDVHGGFLETLTVSATGPGVVTSEPDGIVCGDRCQATFAPGTPVTLTATPDAGAVLAGWRGSTDCYDDRVAVDGGASCTAVFAEAAVPAPGRGLTLNGDRPGDVLLADAAGGRWAFALGAGDGTFNFLMGAWAPRLAITPARLDADPLTDFFLYDRSTGVWTQAINTGKGGFTLTTGTFALGWRFVAGRFRPGAVDDLLAYNPATGGAFLCNVDGAGGFVDFNYKPWSPGWELTVAELSGDAVADVFAYNPVTGQWCVCVKYGDWGFSYTAGRWSPRWSVTAGDLDGNGRDDLFVYSASTGSWFSCLSDGRGGFTYHGESWSPGWVVRRGRFDTDGADDLFVYNAELGWWYQCLSDAAGGFRRYVGGRWSPGWMLAVADLDADGSDDIWVYDVATGACYECLTNPSGGFRRYAPGRFEAGFGLSSALEGRQLVN